MRILWITNIMLPAAREAQGLAILNTGGWMIGVSEYISGLPGVKMAIATTFNGKRLESFEKNRRKYYLIPQLNIKNKPSHKTKPHWKRVCDEFKPDIIHIHGTEYPAALSCMDVYPNSNYVISIQGLVSVIHKYYFSEMSHLKILRSITLRDLLRRSTLYQDKNNSKKRSEYEVEYIRRAQYAIGRTQFDRSHVKSINKEIIYHHCNESLRDEFYFADKWDISKIEKYSLFVTQAGRSIKGLHQLLKAVNVLKEIYPTIRVRIAGNNIIKSERFIDKLKMSGYGKYILKEITTYSLKDVITFTGPLNVTEMIKEFQKSHIYICPSSIENSPNSLGEAQLLGVPCIASYVGGIPDMIDHLKSGILYRFEEFEMLADNITRIFEDNQIAKILSNNGIDAAQLRHSRRNNNERTINIYNSILSHNNSIKEFGDCY